MPTGVTLAALSRFERRQLDTVWELVSSSGNGAQRERKLQARVRCGPPHFQGGALMPRRRRSLRHRATRSAYSRTDR